jgi:hypothetical protein
MALIAAQETLSPREKEELEALETELKDFDDEIDPFVNTLPGSKSLPSAEDLFSAIGADELVIEADFTSHGFTLFGVTSRGIEFVEQRTKTYEEIRRPTMRALKHLSSYPNKDPKTPKNTADLDIHLQEISDELVIPLAHLIRQKKHVIFVISMPLTAFPFSILPYENNEPLFLFVAVSTTPSLSTLLHLSGSTDAVLPPKTAPEGLNPISVHPIAKAIKIKPSLKDREANQETLLHMAVIEAMVISRMFNT